ncbi:TRAP transporter large permease [Rhizobium alvei]|uniref:TRAP transporter large permease protein n=1 Tax=Rhizobium alvei TaxID=1132659 RepID=A0ABT8YSF4_9HYPH|nr:TRAP transporter large permease [Rhizobium alvei]MDO6966694.1 TRAP transporter large permease [Rhizobium alvei]
MFDPFIVAVALIVVLTLAAMPVGEAMLAGTIIYLALSGQDVGIAAETILQSLLGSYSLIAIPLFILAADIMNVGSIADRLMHFSHALVGRFKGGLGHVNIVSSVIFSGMSGSAVADAVGMGRVEIQMMTKSGHIPVSYAAALTAASATIGPIIPPSIPMVLYALVSDASVGYLFAAGIVPGLLMAASMFVVNTWMSHRRDFPTDDSVPLRELPSATIKALPALLLPVILLGGIYSGVMTPTEAAAVAAAYALLVSVLLYRSVSFAQFYRTLLQSGRSTASVGILVAGALAFNYVIAKEDIPAQIALWISGYEFSALGFLLFVNILFLILGCFIDAGAILLIFVPILIPTVNALGIDIIHFGVVVVVNAMIGLITPPYGMLLFIVANFTKQPLRLIVRDLAPFIIGLLIILLIITVFPDFVLFLPRMLGYQG